MKKNVLTKLKYLTVVSTALLLLANCSLFEALNLIPPWNRHFVCLKTSNGKNLVAEKGGGGDVHADSGKSTEWETFEMIDLNGGRLNSGDAVNLKTSDDLHFLVAEYGGGSVVKADHLNAKEWGTFNLIRVGRGGMIQPGDEVALQTSNGKYVVAKNGGGGTVCANSLEVGEWETFRLEYKCMPAYFDDNAGSSFAPFAASRNEGVEFRIIDTSRYEKSVSQSEKVIVLVEKEIYKQLKTEVDRYFADLFAEGIVVYAFQIDRTPFMETLEGPWQQRAGLMLRVFVRDAYNYAKMSSINSVGQRGLVLIGAFPAAFINQTELGTANLLINASDYVLADIDGFNTEAPGRFNGAYTNASPVKTEVEIEADNPWEAASKLGYELSHADRKIMRHYAIPEMYYGRIDAFPLTRAKIGNSVKWRFDPGGLGEEVSLLKSYFNRNHEWRNEQRSRNRCNSALFFLSQDFPNAEKEKDQIEFIADLIRDTAPNIEVSTRIATPGNDSFDTRKGFLDLLKSDWRILSSASHGQIAGIKLGDGSVVGSGDIMQAEPNVKFHIDHSCDNGSFMHPLNMSTTCLFYARQLSWLGWSGPGTIEHRPLYSAMLSHQRFGAAVVNNLLVYAENNPGNPWRIYFATLLGDPTLRVFHYPRH